MTGVYQNQFVIPSKCKEYHTEYAAHNRERRRKWIIGPVTEIDYKHMTKMQRYLYDCQEARKSI